VQPLRPWTKAGIVAGAFVGAGVVAFLAVLVWQWLTDGPAAQASSGMYAFGDVVLGFGVFGLLSLIPFLLGLYWLRPVASFWFILAFVAVLFVLTGPAGVVVASWEVTRGHYWGILGLGRVWLMPFTALLLLTCGLFSPAARPRWTLVGVALAETAVFAGHLIVTFL
jgi:hypothetical protein